MPHQSSFKGNGTWIWEPYSKNAICTISLLFRSTTLFFTIATISDCAMFEVQNTLIVIAQRSNFYYSFPIFHHTYLHRHPMIIFYTHQWVFFYNEGIKRKKNNKLINILGSSNSGIIVFFVRYIHRYDIKVLLILLNFFLLDLI